MSGTPVALVTGANRGLGFETARQLIHERGFSIWLGSRDIGKGREAAKRLGDRAKAVQLDVSDSASVAAAFKKIEAAGRLDVVVNNAGLDYDTDQRASSADLDRIRHTFDTNLFGAWDVAIHAVPLLKHSKSARIVNVSSGAGALDGMSGGTAGYGVSKAALNALTLKLAAELKGDKIKVNAVCPGWVATDMGGGGRAIPDGARGIVWAASLGENGPTGGFFRDGKPINW